MKNFSFKMAGKTAEILFYGDIGDVFDGISARMFAEELKALGKVSEINLRMNSAGGSAYEGITIYNTLLRHPARVVVDIDGMALSAASLVAMAGDVRRMADNAALMIHDPWTVAVGTSEDLRKDAEILDGLKGNVRETYSKRTGNEIDDIASMMANETWMNATEALEFGFINEVTGATKAAASTRIPKDRFHRVPARLAKSDTSIIESYKAEVAKRWRTHTGKQK